MTIFALDQLRARWLARRDRVDIVVACPIAGLYLGLEFISARIRSRPPAR